MKTQEIIKRKKNSTEFEPLEGSYGEYPLKECIVIVQLVSKTSYGELKSNKPESITTLSSIHLNKKPKNG